MHIFTAYDGCETPVMRLTMKWESSWMGKYPQQPIIACPLGVLPQILGKFQQRLVL
jgi:hypothetical protein